MRIQRICYPVEVLGPGKRAGIWVTGCRFGCPGCTAPELQSFTAGNELSVDKIIRILKQLPAPPDGITISGGEPFEQCRELRELIEKIRTNITTDIIVYSGYTIEELHKKASPDIEAVLGSISVLIDGRYREELNDGVGLRGSSNQRIIIFENATRYAYMATCRRELQAFHYPNNSSILIGLLS